MTAYKAFDIYLKNYLNAFYLFENEIMLPFNNKMADDILNYMISNFVEIIK